MQRPALFAALAAIALWGVLAALSLRLRDWPPFLLAGAALLVGAACSIHRLRDWRVPGRARALGVYGLFGFPFLLVAALPLGPPLSVTPTVTGLVPGPCVSVGVQLTTPLLPLIVMPAGAPGSKV